MPKTQEELLSTAPPRSADDPEISIFPSKCSKLPSTQIPPAVWRQNLVSRLQLKLRWSEYIGKITPHNGPHYGLRVSRWGHNYIPCAWTYWMPKPIIATLFWCCHAASHSKIIMFYTCNTQPPRNPNRPSATEVSLMCRIDEQSSPSHTPTLRNLSMVRLPHIASFASTYDPTRDVPKYCGCHEIQSPRVHRTLVMHAARVHATLWPHITLLKDLQPLQGSQYLFNSILFILWLSR